MSTAKKATTTSTKPTKKRGRPKKKASTPPLSVNKTIVTIHPDGIITVEKTEETVTEQVMTKGAST